MKNYKKYGPTGMLWALYLIVGIVAFVVSNLYFKFELQDAIIFGVVNLVAVVAITEGIDWIFKKVRLRHESKPTEEVPSDETVEEVPSTKSVEKETPNEESVEEIASDESVDDVPGDSVPAGEGHVDDEAPILITGRPGMGNGYWSGAHLVAEKNAESAESEAKASIVDADAPESTVESSAPVDSLPHNNVEDAIVEQEIETSTKPRGRRANPDAVIDAPTSSIPIITPDMIKPRVEPAVVPVAVEPVVEKPYLSANDFLDATKLTSPRAIVREYQRLGGKDDIYSILAERKK